MLFRLQSIYWPIMLVKRLKKNLKTYLVLLFVLFLSVSKAQHLDSIRSSFRQESSFFITIDSHNSFIGGKLASITGLKAGLSYGKLVKVGIGLFGLSNPYAGKVTIKAPDGVKDTTISAELKFSYFGLFFDYTIYQKKRWMFSIPLQLGFGGSSYQYYKKNEGLVTLNSGGIILFEPAVIGHYKITRWFGVGLGAGFRLMLVPNYKVAENFTSPIYVLKLKIFLDELYYMVFPRGITGKSKPREKQF